MITYIFSVGLDHNHNPLVAGVVVEELGCVIKGCEIGARS